MTSTRRGAATALSLLLVVATACSDDGTSSSAPPSTVTPATSTTAPEPDARLTVEDRRGVGAVGDDLLSLAEAIRLSNGDLPPVRLSTAESGQVEGTPGPDSSDLIEIQLPTGAEVVVPEQQPPGSGYFVTGEVLATLPPLVGNDGDRIDGGGARLTNGSGGVIGGIGLVVSSSDVVIEHLTLQRFLTGIEISPASGQPLAGVQIRDNVIEGGGGIAGRATSSSGEVTVVSDLVIADNELRGPAELGLTHPYVINQAIGLQAVTEASTPSPDGEGAFDGVAITGNVIRGFPNGLGLSAVTRSADVDGLASRLSDVRIEGNDIEMLTGSFDPALYLWGASNLGGAIDDVTVEDVSVVDNQLRSNGHVILATASEQVIGNGMDSSGIRWDGLSISGNTLGPADSCEVGMMVASSFQEITSGSQADDIAMGGVLIEDNEIDCAAGVIVSPAVNFGSGATGEDISLEDVTVRANRFEVDDAAVVAAAGRVIETILGGAESSPDALVQNNTLDGLVVVDNDLRTGQTLIRAYGGLLDGAPGRAIDNQLLGLEVGGNTIPDGAQDCRVVHDEPGRHGGRAQGNRVDAVGC